MITKTGTQRNSEKKNDIFPSNPPSHFKSHDLASCPQSTQKRSPPQADSVVGG